MAALAARTSITAYANLMKSSSSIPNSDRASFILSNLLVPCAATVKGADGSGRGRASRSRATFP